MSFREKAQLVVVSVAITLTLAAGLYYLVNAFLAGPRGGADDAPILIAGGSLYLGTDLPAVFKPDANKQKLVYESGYEVYSIDVTDNRDVTTPYPVTAGSGTATIVITYCNTLCVNKDVVTINVDNRLDPAVTITNSPKNIGKAPRLLPNLWTHRRKGWHIDEVKLKVGTQEPDVDCDNSECDIVVQTKNY